MAHRSVPLSDLGKDIGVTFGRQLGAMVVGVGLVALLARMLGPLGNGSYWLAVLLPSVLATFFNLGIGPANTYYVSRGSVSVAGALRASLLLWLVVGALGTGVGVVVVSMWAESLFPGVPRALLWWSLGVFPFMLLHSYLVCILQGKQDFGRFNRAMFLPPMTILTVAVLAVVVFQLGVGGAIAAFAVGQITAAGATLAMVVPAEPANAKYVPSWSYIKRCMDYGWKAHLSNVATFLNYRLDLFLVNLLIGPAAAGVYIVSVKLAEQLWMLPQAVATVLLPELSRLHGDDERRRYLTPLICRSVLVVSAIAAGALAVVGFPLILGLFGTAYAGAYRALIWLLPGVIAVGVTKVVASDLAARGRPDLNLWTATITLIVNATANLLLIPVMGISGAAAATTLSYAVSAVLVLFFYTRLSSVSWWESLSVTSRDYRVIKKQLLALLAGTR